MIPQWVKDLVKGIIAILLYSLGRHDEANARNAKEFKADIDWRKSIDERRQDILNRYRDIESRTPDDWDTIEQLRKASEMQPVNKAISSKNN